MALSHYIPLCDAIVHLMHPLVEVVIHDIASDSILYIAGKLSKRKIGDPSLLDKAALSDVDQIIYPKINFDGKCIKSISVILEDKWLLCINCDISVFNKMQDLSQAFLQNMGTTQPKSLFANDWQEKLHHSIHAYLQQYHLSLENLNNTHKKALVTHLFVLGAFNEKNAADYIANILHLGRATVFNYLRALRTHEN